MAIPKAKNVNFSTFLRNAKEKSFWEKTNVFCFYGVEYSPLFFFQLFQELLRVHVLETNPSYVPLTSLDKISLQGMLHQTFLGKTLWYWFGECSMKFEKKIGKMLEIICSYNGSHILLLFLPALPDTVLPIKKISKTALYIEIETALNRSVFEELLTFFGKVPKGSFGQLSTTIFSQVKELYLDQACMIAEFLDVMNMRSTTEIQRYLIRVIEPTRSLLSLSKTFFSKQPSLFFRLWADMASQYSLPFWCAFWSQQLWQAYHVALLSLQGKFGDAKEIGYRLPFSFFSYGWKKFSPNELVHAHNFVYRIDYATKRGSSFCWLDAFYAHFFHGIFRKGNCLYPETRP